MIFLFIILNKLFNKYLNYLINKLLKILQLRIVLENFIRIYHTNII